MAEFVHIFQAGRMNKDLDERLVPNGEYRDALNLDLANSDASDVGAMQNIAGTIQLRSKAGTGATWTGGYIDAMTNPVCIGSYRDDINERIYWFIASDGISAIAEYDQTKNEVSPVLVDTAGILNFSSDYLITGINILDKFLFWTDDQTEPKKINIGKFKTGSTDFITQTKIPKWEPNQDSYNTNLSGRPDFVEADVTTIKLSPLTAPAINASVSEYGNNIPGTGLTPVTTTFNYEGLENFTFIPDLTTAPSRFVSYPTYGEYLENRESGAYINSSFNNAANNPNYDATYGWTGEVTFQISTTVTVWEVGKLITINGEFNNIFGENVKYSIQMSIVSVSGLLITGRIQAISSNIGKTISGDGTSTPIVWEAVLEEKDPLFEYNFPRFAYRWKYIDNEYSVYSPFSAVAFAGGEFEYLAADGYNLGMVNNIRKLLIDNLTWGSDEVSELDILYKEARSTAVYVVDTLKKQDYTSLPTSFEIKNELIGAVVEANQILRPWDNVPRRAKSQEIIGNRIVYGNYLQNYDTFGVINLSTGQTSTAVDLSLSLFSETHPGNATNPNPNPYTRLPRPSLKSIRTYQIGVVYKDAYGRETPVFSSQNASLKVEINKAVSISKLQVTPNNIPPAWATHYKFFVKETANEYYNLALDKFYPAEDGNVWLSFPSSERNKIDEETYLILKKQHDNNVPVETLNRYKILAIQSEAPLFVSQFDEFVASADVVATNELEPGRITINFTGPSNDNNPAFFSGFNGGNKIKISVGGNDSEFYNVVDVSNSGSSGEEYTVQLTEPLGIEVPNVAINDTFIIKIYTEEKKDLPEFDGRFFAKINRDFAFDTNIISSFKALAPRYAIKDEIDFLGTEVYGGLSPFGKGYYYADNAWNGGSNCNDGSDPHNWGLTGWTGPNWGPFGNLMGYEEDWNGGYAPPTLGRRTFGFVYAGVGSWSNVDFMSGNTGGHSQVRTPTGLISPGAKIRFKSKNGTFSKVYQILEATSRLTYRGQMDQDFLGGCFDDNNTANSKLAIILYLNEPINDEWMPEWNDWATLNSVLPSIQVVQNVSTDGNKLLTSSNPAIFETEPKESVNLDLYYEASDAIDISDYNNSNQILNWFNCYSYGTGVESNRIRDDYNAVFIDKGPKVSTVLDEPYAAERRGSGFIFSQIYNSTSGINRLNQFIQAEPITKDLNPIYGTIQKLHARDTDLISLCEDKCLRVLANKDALFNADGNSNVTSNQAVLGQAVPYAGEFGISKNPESFASYGFRVYFTDKNRGAVIRLSRDGITNIAEKGMSSFFADNLRTSTTAIGSYDDDKDIYNLTLDNLSNYWQKRLSLDAKYQLDPDCEDAPDSLVPSATISFKESVDGWTSRKSFIQESGITLNNLYYTFKSGLVWLHGANAIYNNFYDVQYDSSFNVLINEMPQVVKGFSTLNYTGTASRVFEYQGPNEKWYSIAEVNANQIIPEFSQIKKHGWYTSFVRTDLEAGEVKEFQKKEGKYFNYIKGTLIGCEPDGGGIGPCLDCGEDTPQDYLLTVTIDETCSSSGSPIPDTDFRGWYQWNAKGITSPIIDELTAQDAKCIIDDFYAQVSGNYSEVVVYSNHFKYVFEDGISVGTQMYDSTTLEPVTTPGCYLYIKNPPGALPNSPALDPGNPTEAPVTYFIVIWGADGIIDSVTPYISLTVCQALPDTYWSMWTTFQVITQETGSHIENLNNYSNALDSKCALEDLYQLTVDETSTGGSQSGIGFYFYSNIGFGEGTQLYAQNGIPLSLNSPGAHLLVRPPAENNLNNDVFIRDNGVSAPDSYEIVIVGSNGVVESITQYNTITGSCSEDPYEPIEGQDFRFIATKTASPYFGLFDNTLTEVSSPYTFAPVPNHISSVVAKVSDNYNYMLTAGLYDSQPVYLSTDNGESWSNSTFSANKNNVHISRSGQVMIIESGGFNNALIEVSNNFGDSFTTFNLDNIITLGTSVSFLNRVALSSGGKFITISVFANGGTANDNKYRILKSSDYGASFSDITDNVGFPFTGARFTVDIQDGLISGNGKYEIYFNAAGLSRYSDDYGETFIDKNYAQIDWNPSGQISENGKYFMLEGGQNSRYSTDFGASETLLAAPNSSYGDIGVNSSGEFSFATGSNSNSMSYSNDFFDTFTTIGPVADVTKPFILVDVG
jgi:hypothetical protein